MTTLSIASGIRPVITARDVAAKVAAPVSAVPFVPTPGDFVLDSSRDEQAFDLRFTCVPPPADAIECDVWRWRDGEWRRHFLTREWEVNGLWVSVAGEQDHHGQVRRWVHVGGEDQCTSSDRRQLIAALTGAGQLLDSLTQAHEVSTSSQTI